MTLLQFPYKPPVDRDTARLPREEATDSDELLPALLHDPFQSSTSYHRDKTSTGHGRRANTWPPPFDFPFGAAEYQSADWRSPYRIPADLIELFLNCTDAKLAARIQRLKEHRGLDWSRRTSPWPSDLKGIAMILDDLAAQTETIASQLRTPRGRALASRERAFRKEFAAYAKLKSGKYLDAIGAAVFSVTFGSVEAKEYARLRQRDMRSESEGTGKARTTKRRKAR